MSNRCGVAWSRPASTSFIAFFWNKPSSCCQSVRSSRYVNFHRRRNMKHATSDDTVLIAISRPILREGGRETDRQRERERESLFGTILDPSTRCGHFQQRPQPHSTSFSPAPHPLVRYNPAALLGSRPPVCTIPSCGVRALRSRSLTFAKFHGTCKPQANTSIGSLVFKPVCTIRALGEDVGARGAVPRLITIIIIVSTTPCSCRES
jgi:hypothetical protein